MIQYRSDIDGLRAIAVLSVILFHIGFPLSGGFLGVDIFFVISGFLITSIIIKELMLDAGNFSYLNFIERRIRRIVPAALFMLFLTIPFAWFIFTSRQMESYTWGYISSLTFWSNFYFWQSTDYFAIGSELRPLLHTWSLSVEEQFYIFFPLLLMLLWKLKSKTFVVSILSLLVFISLLITDYASSRSPVATFYLMPTRAWELGFGSLGAFFYFNYQKKILENKNISTFFSTIGLIGIFLSVIFFSKEMALPNFYSLLPVFSTLLVLVFNINNKFISKILSYSPVVFLGQISYSLYLMHQPLFAFFKVRFGEPSLVIIFLLLFILLLISWISFRYVETPFRSKKVKIKYIFWMFFLAVFFAFMLSSKSVQEFRLKSLINAEYAPYSFNKKEYIDYRVNNWSKFIPNDKFIKSEKPNLLVLGDSVSEDIAVGLTHNMLNRDNFNIKHDLLDDRCVGMHFNKPIQKIYVEECNLEYDGELKNSISMADIIIVNQFYEKKTLPNVIDFIKELAKNQEKQIILISKYNFIDVSEIAQRLSRQKIISTDLNHYFYDLIMIEDELDYDSISQEFLKLKNVKVMNGRAILCSDEDQTCNLFAAQDNKIIPILYDTSHFTYYGSNILGEKVYEFLFSNTINALK